MLSAFAQNSYSQAYNDGAMRLRVWVHKVWSDANCSEIGDQNYVMDNIRIRTPFNSAGGYDYSNTGFGIRFDGNEARYFDKTQYVEVHNVGSPNEANGYKILDKTYTGGAAPYYFEWISNSAWENDCPNALCGGGVWDYGSCCLFDAESDDDYATKTNWTSNPCFFRGGQEGQVNYFHSDKFFSNENDGDGFAVVFAYQWDWVDALPATCSAPKYSDGPITLNVDITGYWCDSDYDWGSDCVFGSADNEDLRLEYKTWDNLTAEPGAFTNGPTGSVPFPTWDYIGATNILTKSYPDGTNNMESFTAKIQVWEEDGCGADLDYNTGCLFGLGDDDIFAGPITKTVNWRSSPPNTFNYVDVPIRLGSGGHENWNIRLRYRWTIGAPTISTVSGAGDQTYCSTDPAPTLTATTQNCTYYQWQVTDVTGPAGDACPVGATWTDIAGANCESYTVPKTPGTRIYRLVGMNRSGSGSTSGTGPRLNVVYSECTRVTFFPYAPPIISSSITCGSAVIAGATITVSTPTPPSVGGVANATSYTWSVSPSAGVTIATPTATTTDITFPTTQTTYTITLTVARTGCANATSTCTITVLKPTCNYIYVSPTGSDAAGGGPTDPFLTLEKAIAVAASPTLHIRMERGIYPTITNVLNMKTGLIIEGGFTRSGADWIKHAGGGISGNTNETRLIFSGTENISATQEHRVGIKANGVNNWRIQDVVMRTDGSVYAGTINNRGKSNYVLWVRNCTGFEVLASTLVSGNATSGLGGVVGGNGSNGPFGLFGNPGSCDGGNGGAVGGAGSIGAGVRMGGGGGAGGAGSPEHCGCTASNGGNGINGGGGAGGTGGGAGGAGRTDCGYNDGQNGGNGVNGSNGAAGTDGLPISENGDYFTPSGQQPTGGDGGGGGGGKGGGGGSDQYGCTICCDDGGGNGGGSGGTGAYGAAGGTGGFGGGGSFAIYIVANGAASTGSYRQCIFTGGTLGAGGTGGTGGFGRTGGTGGFGNTNCTGEVGSGGNGGKGGDSGDGGRGGNGSPGKSAGIGQWQNAALVTFSNFGGAQPISDMTTFYQYGCTNSEIALTKLSGTWTDYGSGGNLQNIVSEWYSGYTTATNAVTVYYTTVGIKDISTTTSPVPNNYLKYVYIDAVRNTPTIIINPNDTTLCTGDVLALNCKANTNGDSIGYDWDIERITTPNSPTAPGTASFFSGSTVHTPGNVTFINNSTNIEVYQIKLRVKDVCCGWSIPVYKRITVYPNIINTIVPPVPANFCGSGDPGIITNGSLSGGSGVYTYQWITSTDGGLTWGNASGTSTSQTYDPPLLSVVGQYLFSRIVYSDNCFDTSNIVIINIYDQIDGNSVAVTVPYYCAANGANVDFAIVIGSSPSGGNGIYTYTWQTSTDGVNWVNGAGVNNGQNYDPPAQIVNSPGFYYFKRNVSSSTCTPISSNIDSIEVALGPINALSAQVDRTDFCADDNGLITLSVTGGSGNTVNWYSGSCGGTLEGTGIGLNGSFSLPSPTTTTTYYAKWVDNCGNLSSSCVSVQVLVRPLPTITLDPITDICQGITTVNLSYTAITNAPNIYSIDFDLTSNSLGMADVLNLTLPVSPISIAVPSNISAATINGTITVTNTTSGCTSIAYPISFIVNTGAIVVPGGPNDVCQSATPSAITLTGSSVGSAATTGAWSITSGGGTLSNVTQQNNAGIASTTYTPAANYFGTVILTLTSNDPPGACLPSSGTRTINVVAQPNAGADGATTVCDNSSTAIDLFSLITGEQSGGVWTRTTGSGGTFNAGAGTYTPAVGATTSTFTYTITGTAPCGNDASVATVTINPQPNAGADGATTVCDNSSTAIDLFSLITGEQSGGVWTRTTGSGGTFNAGAGTYTPAVGATTSTFTYTITGTAPCGNDASVATVTINPQSNAGADGATTVCDNSSTAIDLFSLITGEQSGGVWTRTTGSGGIFNAGAGTYTPAVGATTSTFTYTITGTAPCGNDASVATVTINPQSNAGADGATTVCDNSSTAIDLFSLITGEQLGGVWTRTTGSGGTFNAGAGTYTPAVGATTSTFTYTITGTAPCGNDASVATVTINPQPNAGADGATTVCDNSSTAIDLFSLITGEQSGGVWTRTTGSGGTFNAGLGTYTPAVGATTSTFTYTITGTAPCGNDASVATVTINPQPNAGADGATTVCDNSSTAIDLFSLITGEQSGGVWTRTTGSGGTFNAGAGTYTPAVGATTSTFTYTITGIAPCGNDASVATVTINPQPNAGADGATTVCDNSSTAIDLFSLITGEQSGGVWTRTTGSGGRPSMQD